MKATGSQTKQQNCTLLHSLEQNTLKFDQIVGVKWDLSTFTWSLLQMIQSST